MSTTTAASFDLRPIWETYVASWKVTSPVERHALFTQCLTPNCEYRDPLVATTGWDELADYMNQFHQQVPGGHFVTEQFSQHHDRSLATWTMCDAGGRVIGQGTSCGQYNEDGQLVAMTGFFETP